MEETNYAITVQSLKKHYHDKEVLKGVDFSVQAGSIYALLGSNGAGKTTTIRILTTQIKADYGRIMVEGYDVGKESRSVHEVISLTGQFSAVDESLTRKGKSDVYGETASAVKSWGKGRGVVEIF